jgi:thioredoxin reductase (NADPH)
MLHRARDNPKIEWALNKVIDEILTKEEKGPIGSREVIRGLRLKDTQTGETSEMTTDGLFVAIGHRPNTDLFSDCELAIDESGYLITEPKSSKTKLEGVFACGDVQDSIYRQAVTAAGSGCMAAIDAERFLAEHH